MPPRVLIVSAGLLHEGRDPRTIRAQRLIAGLAERRLEVDVVSLWAGEQEPPAAPAGCRRLHAIRANPFQRPPDRILRLARRGRRHLSSDPERLRPWALAAEAELAGLGSSERPDLVYAIGVPVGALTAGAVLAELFGVPLVVDIGDPWGAAADGERDDRAATLAAAAALVTTNEELAEQLQPLLAPEAPTLIAPAGGRIMRRAERGADEPPLLVSLGSINAGRIAPGPAYEALTHLHGQGRIEFRSHCNGWHPDFASLPHPQLPMLEHEAALELTASAAAALVLGNQNSVQVPSKAYEIACTETWALCVSELDDDPAVALLERTGHAVRARGNDRASICAAVETVLAREARGERPTPAAELGWDRRLDEIAELCERLVAPAPEPA